jgi:hypothetical protein
MFSLKKVLAGALGAGLVIAGLVFLPASPAVAAGSWCHPATQSFPQPCISTTGTGLYIGTLSGWGNNATLISYQGVHIELYGPNGLIKNCPDFNLSPGYSTPVCSWSPNHNEPAGTYGQTIWLRTGTNSYRSLSGITVGVHA